MVILPISLIKMNYKLGSKLYSQLYTQNYHHSQFQLVSNKSHELFYYYLLFTINIYFYFILAMIFYRKFILFITYYQNKMINLLNISKYNTNSFHFPFYLSFQMSYIWIIFIWRVIMYLIYNLLLDLYIFSLNEFLFLIFQPDFNHTISTQFQICHISLYNNLIIMLIIKIGKSENNLFL